MTKINLVAVSSSLAAAVDPTLAAQFMREAEDLEREFALRHWKYSELDGGRLCEIAARIIYAADSGITNLTKSVESCIAYIENDNVPHNYNDRQALSHIAKVVKAAYKLRSQRGAVHVTPKYTADELDARFVLECGRWIMADILRLFATASRDDVTALIEELSTYPVPLVRSYSDRRLLQHTGFTTEEEVLAILYFGPSEGITTPDLVRNIPKDGSGIRRSIQKLASGKSREIINIKGQHKITDLGIRRVESVIAQKTT